MSSIFLSHSSQDNAIAHEVKARLEQWGHQSVFLDFDPEDGILAGRDWEKELYAKLRECRAVIVLCSKASMASRWCFAEITHAKSLGKPVFPIKVDDAQVDRVMTSVQAIDATAGWDQAYQRLETGLLAAGLDPKGTFDWDSTRPPYPGLLAFQEQDAAIFFGRKEEINQGLALLNRLQQFGGPRLTLMLGASGSGKSSLMRAGLLPRLKRDQRWLVVDPFRPHKAPFDELAAVLSQRFRQLPQGRKETSRDMAPIRERIRWEEQESKQCVEAFMELVMELRETDEARDATVLLMIDQFEELLAGGAKEEGDRFLAFLRALLDREDSHLMVLATLRSDFLGSFQDHPAMRGLRVETFPVPQMQIDDFTSVIEEPAKIAGLELGPGLVQAMVNDTETSDALPLLAFTLRELYEGYGEDKRLTIEEYCDKLGRLDGCIARASEAVLKAKLLSEKEIDDLRATFLSMVRVANNDQYAKQPASWNDIPLPIHDVLERFIIARLLISGGDEKRQTLEVAHEALFRAWPTLKGWVDNSATDLQLIDYAEETATRWHKGGTHFEELWRLERIEEVQRALTRFKRTPSPQLQNFFNPLQILIERSKDTSLSHHDRFLTVKKLAEVGDRRPGVGLDKNGLPDIVWVEIPGGQQVKPFRIAKFPVTNQQFEAFVNADDGYRNKEWWKGRRDNEAAKPSWQEPNVPRETVSWFEAVAFCTWLSAKTMTSIRLPTKWEWQRAATGEKRWDVMELLLGCNSSYSGLFRTTAVGMYPQSATKQGVLDMVGNVQVWCLNFIEEEPRRAAICGSCWDDDRLQALDEPSRSGADIGDRDSRLGFRLVQDIEPNPLIFEL